MPNCEAVLTPFYFKKNLNIMGGDKQFGFNGYIEQLYLHSGDYHQKNNVLNELNVKPGEYVIVRYIAYDAHHDLTIKHLSDEERLRLIEIISKRYRVFLSIEQGCSLQGIDQYLLHISPEKMHDLMAEAKFLLTEGATMASEAFVLGVPYLFVGSSTPLGNLDYQCEHYPERSFRTMNSETAVQYVHRLMNLDTDRRQNKLQVERQTIRPTAYLEWFVEHFPESKYRDYQLP